jgi:hypothetical protein
MTSNAMRYLYTRGKKTRLLIPSQKIVKTEYSTASIFNLYHSLNLFGEKSKSFYKETIEYTILLFILDKFCSKYDRVYQVMTKIVDENGNIKKTLQNLPLSGDVVKIYLPVGIISVSPEYKNNECIKLNVKCSTINSLKHISSVIKKIEFNRCI